MPDDKIEGKIRWISVKLPVHFDQLGMEEEPDDVFFAPFYNPRRKEWRAQVGANYSGYFDATAVVPVYLEQKFHSLENLCNWMISRLVT